ncbi:acyl transferase/acyl hydrolase/lysophospholipase [Massariosphaeria phaeospora]|uniref:Acyl transferase/acyl hydrolase/lysophospholipase n=1 Tax=Massariosphaeria phaeospora TaxID=100035 RepID=A0A7C8ILC8_9PLEO|nr:acyl transferase/acyl hydrolase/lysophospholipase [Massariosphaeria phaeospora]
MPFVDVNDPERKLEREATDVSSCSSQSISGDSIWSSGGRETQPWENIVGFKAHNAKVIYSTPEASIDPAWESSGHRENCWQQQVVLSLDGGGVRGLSELLILQEIMQRVAEIEFESDRTLFSGELPRTVSTKDADSIAESQTVPTVDRFLPCHYFDYICGTSLGGVIAVLLGRLRCSVPEAIQYYCDIWNGMATKIPPVRVLPGNTSKSDCSSGLKLALDRLLQDQQTQRRVRTEKGYPDGLRQFRSNPALCKTLVLAVQYDSHKHVQRPYLFRSYSFSRTVKTSALNRNPDDKTYNGISIQDVCLATSASPDYFRSHKIGDTKFRDGSKWTSNPSMELFREIDSTHAEVDCPLHCFVSIGSGKQNRGTADKALRPFSSGGFLRRESVADREKKLVHRVLTERKDQAQSFMYFRFEGPNDLVLVRPSEWKTGARKKIIRRISESTKTYCQRKDVQKAIMELADELVKYRRRRAATTQWENYVDVPKTETTRHTCKWCRDCDNVDRDRFIEHVKDAHRHKISGDPRYFEQYRAMLRESQVPSLVAMAS